MPDDNREITQTSENHSPAAMLQPFPASSPLEEMPVEIHRLIIAQVPTFDDLRALVHASPQIHRVYAQDRPLLLRHVVE